MACSRSGAPVLMASIACRRAQEEKAQEADLNWKRTEKEMGTQLVETKV